MKQQHSRHDDVLALLTQERRATPLLIQERLGLSESRVHDLLGDLQDRGKVERVSHGLYQLSDNKADPHNAGDLDG